MTYIGTSGFQYPHWGDGVFYPRGTKNLLEYYLRFFNTVEINTSFYRSVPPHVIEKWGEQIPEGSKLVLKAPRSVTHVRRLKLFSLLATDGLTLLEDFVYSLDFVPAEKIGPVLLQLHPRQEFDISRLEDVLWFFTENTIQAAVEPRHRSWLNEKLYQTLEQFNAALVMSDWLECSTELVDVADFLYIRRHGPVRYGGSYSEESLEKLATIIDRYECDHKIFVFFNNDGEGNAPRDALRLKQLTS